MRHQCGSVKARVFEDEQSDRFVRLFIRYANRGRFQHARVHGDDIFDFGWIYLEARYDDRVLLAANQLYSAALCMFS